MVHGYPAVYAGGHLRRQPSSLSVERLIVSPMSTCYDITLPPQPPAAPVILKPSGPHLASAGKTG